MMVVAFAGALYYRRKRGVDSKPGRKHPTDHFQGVEMHGCGAVGTAACLPS
jgi:hypothetical protein